MKISFKRLGFLLLIIALLSSLAFTAVSCEQDDDKEEDLEDTLTQEDEENVETTENHILEVIGYRNDTNYNDAPVIVVKYLFTNKSDDAVTFRTAFNHTAFQDGIEMKKEYFLGNGKNFLVDNEHVKIKDGASIEVEMAYYYNNFESDIEIEIEKIQEEANKKFDLIIELE